MLVRRVVEQAGERLVVLDDQERAVAGRDVVPVITGVLDDHRRLGGRDRNRAADRTERGRRRRRPPAGGAGAERRRQVEGERAALPCRALQLDLAAQQQRQLAADRKTQPGAAVLAAGAAVGLLERLEDDVLL